MDFFEKLDRSQSGHIFLSHSHEDILKVRKIRNSLEEVGFEALCFYLKCLNDDSEIESLITREIDAREWFIFINSENSRKSRWVTLEREYIKKTDSKKILTVELDDFRSVEQAIQKIRRHLRVFMSYAAVDRAVARRISQRLEQKDYLVYSGNNTPPGNALSSSALENAIAEASREGCAMVLLTPNSVHNENVFAEIELALSQNGNVVPVMLGDVELSTPMKFLLKRLSCFRLSEDPTVEEIDAMIERLGRSIAC